MEGLHTEPEDREESQAADPSPDRGFRPVPARHDVGIAVKARELGETLERGPQPRHDS